MAQGASRRNVMEELDLESSRRRLARIANALGPYRRGVEETLSLTAEHPDMAAARAGKALEAFLVAVHNKRLPSEPRKDLTLEQLQQALAKELRDDVKMHSQVVQRFRNHGAHHREVALRPSPPCSRLRSGSLLNSPRPRQPPRMVRQSELSRPSPPRVHRPRWPPRCHLKLQSFHETAQPRQSESRKPANPSSRGLRALCLSSSSCGFFSRLGSSTSWRPSRTGAQHLFSVPDWTRG
jgi:hypothetical protein